MAGRSATLTVKIVSDAKSAAAGFDEAESRVGRFQSGLDRASVAAGGVLLAVGAVAKAALDSASSLQQATGAVEATFGTQAAAVKQLAADAATSVGLAQSDYSQLAAVLGSQLQNMGVSADQVVGTTDRLITTGADLAAQFGGSTSEAVEALGSLLRGERDPIERYGVSITQAGVDAKVAALGLDTSTEAAKRAADTQATLALVADQSATAQGAFAREADTAAGAQQRASAQFENAKAALGDVLLPVVAAAAAKFAEFTGFLTEHQGMVMVVIGAVAALAATILVVNGAMMVWNTAVAIYRGITAVATAMQWAWNAAMLANPIMIVVLAIIAIIAIIVLAYNKFSWFRDIVDAIGNALLWAFEAAQSAIQWVIDKLSWIGDAASWVGDLFSAPQTMAITPVAAGDAAGLFGAADATGAWAPIRGASMGSLPGGTSPSAGQGTGGTVVNVTVNGALDPVSVGRQIEKVLRDYGRATGRQLTLTMGTA